MKKYKVNLNFIAPIKIKEDEICELFDNIIYYIEDKKVDDNIIWILDFELNDNYTIEEQIEIITSHIINSKIKKLFLKKVKILFDIQIYYDTYTCSFNISSKTLKSINKLLEDIDISFSLYPTDFSS